MVNIEVVINVMWNHKFYLCVSFCIYPFVLFLFQVIYLFFSGSLLVNTMSAVSPGAIVGIIIVVIFMVIAIITVVGLVVLYVLKHYQKWKPSVSEVAMSKQIYADIT